MVFPSRRNALFRFLGHLGQILVHLGPIFAPLGPILAPPTPISGHLGPIWARSWKDLGPIFGYLGRSWAALGPILGHLRPILGPLGVEVVTTFVIDMVLATRDQANWTIRSTARPGLSERRVAGDAPEAPVDPATPVP